MDRGTGCAVWDGEGADEWRFRPVAVFRGGGARKYDAPRQGTFDGGAEGVVDPADPYGDKDLYRRFASIRP